MSRYKIYVLSTETGFIAEVHSVFLDKAVYQSAESNDRANAVEDARRWAENRVEGA